MAIKKYFVSEDKFGNIGWYKDAACTILHREDGPAFVTFDGTEYWYQNGLRHREDGPAVKYTTGSEEWYMNGKRHRMDGPAIMYDTDYRFWYINGTPMTEAEFLSATQPVVEMTVADVEKLLGKRVKIVK